MNRTALALAMLASLCVPALAVCGDANADGSTNILDALSVAYEVAGVPPGVAGVFADADVNGSGTLEIMDALLIAQYSASIINQLACSPPPPPPGGPEQFFLGSSYPNQITVVDAASLTVTQTIPLQDAPVSLAADPVRDRVYVQLSGGQVQIIETGTNTLGSTFTVPGLTGHMKVSPDGAVLVGDAGGNVVIYDLTTSTVRNTVYTGSWGYGMHVAFTPGSDRVYATLTDLSQVAEISLVSNTLTRNINVGGGPWGITVNDAGTTGFVINHNEQTMSRFDVATGTEIQPRVPVGNYPMDLEAGNNGNVFAVNCIDDTVGEHNGANGQQQAAIPVGNEPTEIEESAQGLLVVMNSFGYNASIVDPAGQISPVTIPLGGSPTEPAIK